MKKILLLISTLISVNVNAQTSVYHPFPDSNAVWTGESSIQLFPNPFHLSSNLQLGEEFVNRELILYNTPGNRVGQQIVPGKSVLINRNGLCNGIYFFKVISPKGKVAAGKFIIE